MTRPDAATEAAKSYAIAMADTVLVPEGDSGGELLTGVAARTWTDNAYFVDVRCVCSHPAGPVQLLCTGSILGILGPSV